MIRSDALKQNLEYVEERIQLSLDQAGRKCDDVRLIVVTKTHSADIVEELLELGLRDIGESYVQEALAKQLEIANLADDYSDVSWHMLGHVQSRKAAQVVEHFDFLHSVDSIKLANRLNAFAKAADKKFPILLQMNLSGEESKFGFDAKDESRWGEITEKISLLIKLENLAIQGLMSIPPYDSDPNVARRIFAKTRKLRDYSEREFPEIEWHQLSMGMSADFESAILEGSTMLRLGTAILGPRSTI